MNQMQKNVFLTYFKTTFLLITTFCLGCIIATGVARMLENSKNTVVDSKPDPADFRDVFVLKNAVREGKEILPDNIIVVQLHKDEVSRSAVKTYQQIEGRAARSEIPQGKVLLDEYFVPQITKSTVNGFIPPGFHSVTIQIHEMGVDGQSNISVVKPGDEVDVILVKQNVEKEVETGEFVLLEKIPVIDTFWDEIGDFQRNEKKGSVSLLLSDSQRKNLEEKYQNAVKIRLRICSPVETPAFSRSQPQSQAHWVASRDFYQTDNPPELLSQSLREDRSPIEIVFRHKQELKPINHNELHISSFRGISAASYAGGNAEIPPVSTLDKQNPVERPDLSPPAARYSSFFDASGHQGHHGNTQWRAAFPSRFPVVFEAPSHSATQARGIYRDGGVYYSAE